MPTSDGDRYAQLLQNLAVRLSAIREAIEVAFGVRLPTAATLNAEFEIITRPTKDGGVLRTIDDARAYMMALPKKHEQRAHWQHAYRLLLQQASPAALTRQVQVALFMDGKLDAGAFEHMSSARRWRRHARTSSWEGDTR
jgi:hypothetical protein